MDIKEALDTLTNWVTGRQESEAGAEAEQKPEENEATGTPAPEGADNSLSGQPGPAEQKPEPAQPAQQAPITPPNDVVQGGPLSQADVARMDAGAMVADWENVRAAMFAGQK